MSFSPAVARVVSVLESAGYHRFDEVLLVAGIPFRFPAVLARDTSLDLVVVVDRIEEQDGERLLERIAALSRALDVAGSRRPLTVVLVGPRPELRITHALRDVARILSVSEGQGDATSQELLDALGALLPLRVAVEPEQDEETWPAVRRTLLSTHSGEDSAALIKASPGGPTQVENALRTLLSAPFLDERR
jgi:hypothetical protein